MHTTFSQTQKRDKACHTYMDTGSGFLGDARVQGYDRSSHTDCAASPALLLTDYI